MTNTNGPMKVTDDERITLQRLIRVLEEFRRLGGELPVQLLLTFLHAAHTQGMSLTDLVGKADLKLSTASRIMQQLSELDRNKEPGLDILTYHKDPAVSRRTNVINLTHKGRMLLTKVLRPFSEV